MRRTTFSLKDFYKILGVSKGASAQEMKKAYKKKAAQLHPDVSKSPNASEEFAELNGAYETLKCDKKRGFYEHTGKAPSSDADVAGYQDFVKAQRSNYQKQQQQQQHRQQQYQYAQAPRGGSFQDQYGFGGFDFEFADDDPYTPEDLGGFRRFEHNPWEGPGVFYTSSGREVPPWEEFMMHDTSPRDGGHWRKRPGSRNQSRAGPPPPRPAPVKGKDRTIDLSITLGESIKGVTKQVNFKVEKPCIPCEGTGKSRTSARRCENCSGAGSYLVQLTPADVVEIKCEQCNGTGIEGKPCSSCRGSSLADQSSSLMVGIPPGLQSGHSIRYCGQGNCGSNGGAPGDLVITLNVTFTDSGFIRAADGTLYVAVKVPFNTAIFGGVAKIKSPTGETVDVEIPAGTSSMHVFDIDMKGLPTWPSGHQIIIDTNNKSKEKGKPTTGAVKGIAVIDVPSPSSLTPSQVEALKSIPSLDEAASPTLAPHVRDTVFKFMLANFSPKKPQKTDSKPETTSSTSSPKSENKNNNSNTSTKSSSNKKSTAKTQHEAWRKSRTKSKRPKQRRYWEAGW
eukprot:TRINITY_DN7257_c0_g1_i2.p1 TRINITY_DN7257_c0_g1~~TRINITY_DN7257_c0_g1_i2.p1  ORF type:complete len:579 (+),score=110.50 TRINITY_DN7257_c0_g1_i2:46-1737(+)